MPSTRDTLARPVRSRDNSWRNASTLLPIRAWASVLMSLSMDVDPERLIRKYSPSTQAVVGACSGDRRDSAVVGACVQGDRSLLAAYVVVASTLAPTMLRRAAAFSIRHQPACRSPRPS